MGIREKWKRHCVFRVPPRLKVGRGDVFTPQTVALGPFHHNDDALRPMEAHKLRAVRRLLRRAGDRPWRELEDAFLEMMVTDGCFLLEVMRGKFEDYDPHDPVFGEHAMKHIEAFVLRDMLMIENQLPLSLLRRIVEFETGKLPEERWMNNLVAEFLRVDGRCAAGIGPQLGLHPLDVYRRCLLWRTASINPQQAVVDRMGHCCFPTTGRNYCLPTRRDTVAAPPPRLRDAPTAESSDPAASNDPPPRSAKRLWEAGVCFRSSETRRLDDIHFNICSRRLEMHKITLDDSTEYKFSNLMAFEALHFDGTDNRNGLTAFVLFMRDMIDSKDDVAVLREGKVLENELAGSDKAVVALFNRLTMDVSKFGDSKLCQVRKEIERYCDNHKCRVFIFRSWAKLRNSHLSSPWAFMALVFSLLLIGTDITQTLYTVMTY
ncbi:hypothetical protein HU200_038289 [Digitaria exilis]|uniref:Uncharacterized protein n=1 Tax=Digitaria exilis TaxID=1010633 RepID=A0A835BAB4_9POAL|nr:hypothetical protein HU200_038289 [Digitaria exilis]